MFIGNLNYVVIAVIGGLRVAHGSLSLGDVQAFIQYTPPVHPAAHHGRLDDQPAAVRASPRPSGSSSCSTPTRRSDGRRRADRSRRSAAARCASSTCRSATTEDRPLIEDLSLVAQPGPDRRDRRPDRRRQDHAGQPGDALLRPRRRPDHPRRRRHHRDAARRAARADRDGAPGHLALRAARSATTSPTAARTRPRSRCSRPRGRRSSTGSCTRCPTATTRSSTRTAPTCPPASASCVTIARAFLTDPALLILDEATSLGRHPHRAAAAAGDGRAAHRPHVVRHRAPALHDPRRRPDPGDGGRARSSSRAPTTSCSSPSGAYARLYHAQFAAAPRGLT